MEPLFILKDFLLLSNISRSLSIILILCLILLPFANLFSKDEYFWTLRNDKTNLRQGPSFDFQVKVFYKKKVKLPFNNKSTSFKVVGSRSHQSPETKEYFDDIRKRKKNVEIVSMGSSIKICLVAEGSADVYPRFAPTMEWDTAAGHAIAKYAGKKLIDLKTNKEMVYNRERLTNNWFIVEWNNVFISSNLSMLNVI